MKKLMIAVTVSMFVLAAACHGTFSGFKTVQNWNGGLGDKWVNSLVHFAMWVVPAYEVILLGDLLIFNTVEFWTGSNPLSANITTDGDNVLVQVHGRTYELRPDGANRVAIWRTGDRLGLVTRTPNGWAWEDEASGRSLMVRDDEARALVALMSSSD